MRYRLVTVRRCKPLHWISSSSENAGPTAEDCDVMWMHVIHRRIYRVPAIVLCCLNSDLKRTYGRGELMLNFRTHRRTIICY